MSGVFRPKMPTLKGTSIGRGSRMVFRILERINSLIIAVSLIKWLPLSFYFHFRDVFHL